MRVYSDVITEYHVSRAFAEARGIDGADIWIADSRTWQPRAWAHGTEFWAYSHHGTRASAHGPIQRGPRNHLPRAASWSDWGFVIARLYLLDSRARIGHYLDRDDFIRKVRADHAFSRRRESAAFLTLLGESVPEQEPRLIIQSAVTGEVLGELSQNYQPCRCTNSLAPECVANGRSCAPPDQAGNPDYVSPELRNARRQQKESEELLDRWADPIVFGRP